MFNYLSKPNDIEHLVSTNQTSLTQTHYFEAYVMHQCVEIKK